MVVYKIEIEGKVYVGSSKNYKKRWKEHSRHLKGNKHHNPYLQRLFNKYGNPEFSIIEQLNSIEQMYSREEHWIREIGELNAVKTAVGGDRVSQLTGEKRKEWIAKLKARPVNHNTSCFQNLNEDERQERLEIWSEAKKGSKNGRYKYDRPVQQLDKKTGEIIRTYKDLCEVVEVTGFERRNILNCLKKKPFSTLREKLMDYLKVLKKNEKKSEQMLKRDQEQYSGDFLSKILFLLWMSFQFQQKMLPF